MLYRTISDISKGEYKEKGSKFIALAYPVSDRDEITVVVDGLKKEYYDARHHCYAWRIGADGSQTRTVDDGEPSSTAGKPILGQIMSNDLTNILIVVIRYFGGTKLGVSGLIQAYRSAAADAIVNAAIEEKTVDVYYRCLMPYIEVDSFMKIIKQMQPRIINQLFDNRCSVELSIRKRDSDELEQRLSKVTDIIIERLYEA